MYPNKNIKEQDCITLKDALKQFPKWYETWQNSNAKNYHGKYKYLYMGFGNGLSIDKKVFNEFKPYLEKEVKEYLNSRGENNNSLQYAAIFNVWENALEKMISAKNKI